MTTSTIRAKVDGELTRRIGKWFTVRDIQNKLKINPSTLKPLIMKYARENVLKRRSIKGTARSVEFTPASASTKGFQDLLVKSMPYRMFGGTTATKQTATKQMAAKKGAKKPAAKKTAKETAAKKKK